MAVLSTTSKGKLSVKTAGAALKNPGATRLATKAAKPAAKARLAAKAIKPAAKVTKPAAKAGFGYRKALAKRRARQRAERVGETARTVGEVLLIKAPDAAQELGLIERPAPRRTAPRVAVGVLIGAGAMYLLEPGSHGKEHREKVAALVG
jgi:hypothetical protein